MNKNITCIVCGNILSGRQTKFCSPKCKNSVNQSYIAQQKRGLRRKLMLINRFGGCCTICGYDKNISALTFHHTTASDKNFQLDMRSLSNRHISRIESELKKCVLVCHNCHSELHYPQHNKELIP